MQLASRNPLFRTGCCWLGNLFCKACWATPFKMHFDFRPLLHRTFAELSRKYPYPQTTAIRRGCIRGKANTKRLGVWLSQSFTFGSLAASFGACFSRLQKATLRSTSTRSKGFTMVFGCGEASPSEARLLPMKGKVNMRYPLLPDPRAAGGRQEMVALKKLYMSMYTIIIHNIQFSRIKTLLSRTRKKQSRGFPA